MWLRRVSSLAILMVALSSTVAIAAPKPLPYDPFDGIIAQGSGDGGRTQGNRHGRGRDSDLWIEQLNLTADQKQAIGQIRQESQSELDDLHEDMRQAHNRMRQLMSSNASDGELRSQHRKMQELHEQMGNLRFEQMLKIRGVLTEQQRQELSEYMQERWEDVDNGGGRRRRRGGVENDNIRSLP